MVAFVVAPFFVVKATDREEGKKGMRLQHLKFRSIADTLAQRHIESSKCCLIHADNPLSL
jgi:hypothetical protein